MCRRFQGALVVSDLSCSSLASQTELFYRPEVNELRPASFEDAKLNYQTSDPNQLAYLVHSSLAASQFANQQQTSNINSSINLLQKAAEAVRRKQLNPETGRTLQDTIDVASVAAPEPLALDLVHGAAFQKPAILCLKTVGDEQDSKEVSAFFDLGQHDITDHASNSAGRFLYLRQQVRQRESQLSTLQSSLGHHNGVLAGLREQRSNLQGQITCGPGGTTGEVVDRLNQLDEIKESEQGCSRVIAQLERQIKALQTSYDADQTELLSAEQESRSTYSSLQKLKGHFWDPTVNLRGLKRTICTNIYNREYGMRVFLGRSLGASPGASVTEIRRTLLAKRFSHAATINSHLSYPVYCLRYDRTGRYFITGADDYLIRVFCLGAHVRVNPRVGLGSAIRGAVLVCTLRGHAGVINNIDVSPDNCFLATASEDGDCRVWGLKDGSPVAILRGHGGGANSAVWSSTVPYRLVTAGGDGVARSWDFREACLKRYSKVVGRRPEYRLNTAHVDATADSVVRTEPLASTIELPPLPTSVEELEQGQPVGPPLPQPQASENGQSSNEQQEASDLGRFFANDSIDEGVTLISKLQHGVSQDGPQATRSRRAAVKVLCIARCPFGLHFATGADDGVCRVWREDDDKRVLEVDRNHPSYSPSLVGSDSKQVGVICLNGT